MDPSVTVSVPGTFHAFHLAEQLYQRDALRRIFATALFSTPGTTLPPEKVSVFRIPEILHEIGNQFPIIDNVLPSRWGRPTGHAKRVLFDRLVARSLQSTDTGLFLGFAGNCLRSLKRANELGLTTVVERSSAHIATQREILETEYERLGLGEPPISASDIAWERSEYETADYISVPSHFVYRSFIDRGYPPEKLIRVPLGVDPLPSGERTLSKETTQFLYVGGVSVRKGVRHLLEAWDLADTGDATLSIVGNIDPEMQWLTREYSDDETVDIHGWIDSEELSRLYTTSDAFIFPSLEDGFGRVVIEAMAAGLPVVVTDRTGAKDCVRDGIDGVIVQAGNTAVLRDKIEWFDAHPNRCREMGERARRSIQNNYTWDDYADRIYRQYLSILSDNRR